MKTYIGTKVVQAEPAEKHTCTDQDCEEGISGYKVVYKDGYESWSPKDTFEEAYRLIPSSTKPLILVKKGTLDYLNKSTLLKHFHIVETNGDPYSDVRLVENV